MHMFVKMVTMEDKERQVMNCGHQGKTENYNPKG